MFVLRFVHVSRGVRADLRRARHHDLRGQPVRRQPLLQLRDAGLRSFALPCSTRTIEAEAEAGSATALALGSRVIRCLCV